MYRYWRILIWPLENIFFNGQYYPGSSAMFSEEGKKDLQSARIFLRIIVNCEI